MTRKLTKDQINSLIETYLSDTSTNLSELANQYGINRSSVRGLLINRGIERRPNTRSYMKHKWSFNEDYFVTIDTEEKAYFLGLLMADGNIHYTTLSLGLHRQDRYMLERFRDALSSHCIVYDRLKEEMSIIKVYSLKMVKDVAKYGLVPNKSLTATPPRLDKSLMRDFWRGAIDGDGCLHVSYSSKMVYLCGSHDMVYGFKSYTDALVQRKCEPRKNGNIWIYTITGEDAKTICSHLYENASIYLTRKYDIYQSMCDFYRAKEEKQHSVYKGATWHKRINRWQSQIRVNHRTIHLGYFDEEKDAALAYDEYIKLHQLSRKINF